jgi:hypothetical protein
MLTHSRGQYFNDTQEIDMEFLSKDFNPSNSSYPVNLVLQSLESADAGYNAQLTGNYVKAYLPFDPTADFHEYRIDLVPGHVYFYADGRLLAAMNGSAVPTTAGHLVLQHWSNGNPEWSGGPPPQDAVVSVRYVKAYFNSSLPDRMRDWADRCNDNNDKTGAVCRIPDVNGTNTTASGWFFSSQDNMTDNQTVYGQTSDGEGLCPLWWPTLASLLIASGWVAGLW